MALKLVTTTEYHPQVNGYVKRFSKTLVAQPLHYFNVHQTNRDN